MGSGKAGLVFGALTLCVGCYKLCWRRMLVQTEDVRLPM